MNWQNFENALETNKILHCTFDLIVNDCLHKDKFLQASLKNMKYFVNQALN